MSPLNDGYLTAFKFGKGDGQAARQAGTAAPASSPAAARSAGGNVMSGNYAGGESEGSRYVQYLRDGFRSNNGMVNRQNGILAAGLVELNAMGDQEGYAKRYLTGKRAERRMREERQTAVSEASERNLRENRDRIAKRTAEATTPKDAEGNPVSLEPEVKAAPPENRAGTVQAAPVPPAEAPAVAATAQAQPAATQAQSAPAGGMEAPKPSRVVPSVNIVV